MVCDYKGKRYVGVWGVIKAHLRWLMDFPL
jgi:hypothetical protein